MYDGSSHKLNVGLCSGGSRGGPQGPGLPLTKIFLKNKKVKFDKN